MWHSSHRRGPMYQYFLLEFRQDLWPLSPAEQRGKDAVCVPRRGLGSGSASLCSGNTRSWSLWLPLWEANCPEATMLWGSSSWHKWTDCQERRKKASSVLYQFIIPSHVSHPKPGARYAGETAVLCWVTQLCPTLCKPMDWSPPVSSAMGILQARMLEWVCQALL